MTIAGALHYIFCDCFWIWAFQICLIGTSIYAFFKAPRRGGVVRGENSRQYFMVAWGALSLVTQQIFQVSTAATGYLVFLSLLDLSLFGYLCFWNGWSRNQIMYMAVAFEKKEDPL